MATGTLADKLSLQRQHDKASNESSAPAGNTAVIAVGLSVLSRQTLC